jgi:RNA polymerase sigma-70 factor (ECF subfamily)
VTRELAHLSDEALVALAARSEQTALGELYDRYARPAYGLALRVLRDESLAEDAVQRAFLSLWRTASRFVPERPVASLWRPGSSGAETGPRSFASSAPSRAAR